MQKFKYLIILALGILLTLVYVQLDDYDSISHSLLDDNIKANETIESLQETIQALNNKNEKLQEDIVFLYNKIDNLSLEIEYMEHANLIDTNTSDLNATEQNSSILLDEENNSTITLENENTITGFGTIDE